jgi:hypothetical protein
MSKDYDFDDIAEITVTLKNKQQFIYKGKGISRLQRTLESKPKTTVIVDDDDRDHQKQTRPVKDPTNGGYTTVSLKYDSPSSKRRPEDIAKEMQKQAEGTLKF